MSIITRCNAMRMPGPVCLGSRFTRFQVRGCDRRFSIHEDLLCKNAKYFKRQLQKNRKDIDGDCSICHEKLDPQVNDVTFCRRSCGQNFHERCIQNWTGSMIFAKCPICRGCWIYDPEQTVLEVLPEDLDRDAIQSYVDWLYTGKLYVRELFREGTSYNLQLLKAWTVSVRFEDDNFRYAIIAEYLSSVEQGENEGFTLTCIKYAFEKHNIDSMRDFVVDAWLMDKDLGHIKRNFQHFPVGFIQRLCLAALLRLKRGYIRRDELLKKHTNGEYEYKENTDGDRDVYVSCLDEDAFLPPSS